MWEHKDISRNLCYNASQVCIGTANLPVLLLSKSTLQRLSLCQYCPSERTKEKIAETYLLPLSYGGSHLQTQVILLKLAWEPFIMQGKA